MSRGALSVPTGQIQIQLLSNIGTPAGQPHTLPVGALAVNPSSRLVDDLLSCMTDVTIKKKATDVRHSLSKFYVHYATDARGTPLGYIAWRFVKGEGREPQDHIRIRRLHVNPNTRSFGVGKALVLLVLDQALSGRLCVKVMALNNITPPATTYFQRFGFSIMSYNNNPTKTSRSDIKEMWFDPSSRDIEWRRRASGQMEPHKRVRGSTVSASAVGSAASHHRRAKRKDGCTIQ